MQQRIELPIDENYRREKMKEQKEKLARIARKEAYDHRMIMWQRVIGVVTFLISIILEMVIYQLVGFEEGTLMLLYLSLAAGGIFLVFTKKCVIFREYEELEEEDYM